MSTQSIWIQWSFPGDTEVKWTLFSDGAQLARSWYITNCYGICRAWHPSTLLGFICIGLKMSLLRLLPPFLFTLTIVIQVQIYKSLVALFVIFLIHFLTFFSSLMLSPTKVDGRLPGWGILSLHLPQDEATWQRSGCWDTLGLALYSTMGININSELSSNLSIDLEVPFSAS